jgi:asparagine synthase (glutamine-hydrolysing)
MFFLSNDDGIFFASEIQPLSNLIKHERDFDVVGITSYFLFNYISGSETFFKQINSVSPGCFVKFSSNNILVKPWILKSKTLPMKERDNLEKTLETLDALLSKSTTENMEHGECNSLLLSGGIDSSLIAKYMRKNSTSTIKAFHLQFNSDITAKNSDTFWAKKVSEKFDLDFLPIDISSEEFFSKVDFAIKSFSQPFAGVLSSYFTSEIIGKHVKTCLTGDGADEIFGSYRRIQDAYTQDRERAELELSQKSVEKYVEDYVLKIFANNQKYSRFMNVDMRSHISIITSRIVDRHLQIGNSNYDSNFEFSLKDDQIRLLPDQVLLFSDHLGMRHHLEMRPPFLSNDIISFARSIPINLLVGPGGEMKKILKDLAAQSFTADFIDRPKDGFFLPLEIWMRTSSGIKWLKLKIQALSQIEDSWQLRINLQQIRIFLTDFCDGSNNDYYAAYKIAILVTCLVAFDE